MASQRLCFARECSNRSGDDVFFASRAAKVIAYSTSHFIFACLLLRSFMVSKKISLKSSANKAAATNPQSNTKDTATEIQFPPLSSKQDLVQTITEPDQIILISVQCIHP